MKQSREHLSFLQQVKVWSDNASSNEFPRWDEQLRVLSEIGDQITPGLALEDVISGIYASVNLLMDAYQFAVGLYDRENETILFKGMIQGGKRFPDLTVDIHRMDRFAPWVIQNESEIFINDMEAEYQKYVTKIPVPLQGISPKAALYVPLSLDGKVVGLITVRTVNKNVYRKHHLYILKTLGGFVIRTLALSNEKTRAFVRSADKTKWSWCAEERLSSKSERLLSLLTHRERDVMMELAKGLSNKEIAEKLFVSDGTIKTHTLSIYQKMEVSSRSAAILKAMELQWIV